jgi:hypothetical protein
MGTGAELLPLNQPSSPAVLRSRYNRGMSDEPQLHVPTQCDRRVLVFKLVCYALFVGLGVWLRVSLQSGWISWTITVVLWIAVGAIAFRTLPRR